MGEGKRFERGPEDRAEPASEATKKTFREYADRLTRKKQPEPDDRTLGRSRDFPVGKDEKIEVFYCDDPRIKTGVFEELKGHLPGIEREQFELENVIASVTFRQKTGDKIHRTIYVLRKDGTAEYETRVMASEESHIAEFWEMQAKNQKSMIDVLTPIFKKLDEEAQARDAERAFGLRVVSEAQLQLINQLLAALEGNAGTQN